MKVLVTGGAGYVGSFTVRRLKEIGHTVLVVDNLQNGYRSAVPGTDIIVTDVRDQEGLSEGFQRFKPEAVIHFAGLKSSEESMRRARHYVDVNVMGTTNVLEAAARCGVERFVLSSSCSVYGSPDSCPVSEETSTNPVSIYGQTKATAESLVEWYGKLTGMSFANLRYFNAAGAAADGSLGETASIHVRELIPMILRTALGHIPAVEIYGSNYATPDGTAVRDYLHVEDLAQAHVQVLEAISRRDLSGNYNLGRGHGYSVLQVVEAARNLVERPITTTIAAGRPGDPDRVWADATKAFDTFGWCPAQDLEDIMLSAWRWHRSRPETLSHR